MAPSSQSRLFIGPTSTIGTWTSRRSAQRRAKAHGPDQSAGLVAPSSEWVEFRAQARVAGRPSRGAQREVRDAWRVSNATSLFDYPPGLSTADYTDRDWPPPQESPAPAPQSVASHRWSNVRSRNSLADKGLPMHPRQDKCRTNCEFDITIMGNLATAAAYERRTGLPIHRERTSLRKRVADGSGGRTVASTATSNDGTLAPCRTWNCWRCRREGAESRAGVEPRWNDFRVEGDLARDFVLGMVRPLYTTLDKFSGRNRARKSSRSCSMPWMFYRPNYGPPECWPGHARKAVATAPENLPAYLGTRDAAQNCLSWWIKGYVSLSRVLCLCDKRQRTNCFVSILQLFEAIGVKPEWSSATTGLAVNTAPSGQHFLGRAGGNDGLSNDTVA